MCVSATPTQASDEVDERIADLLGRMTLEEKIGQMTQRHAGDGVHETLGADLRAGRIGSVLNLVDVEAVNEIQRIAVEESRLGIPLLVARDVIHGFRTVLPIPLGQAASWNPELVQAGARAAAREAAAAGVNWALAPMLDVTRDPRWGRIAESPGEDPYLASQFAAALVRGYQGDDLAASGSMLACAKHFAGYGAVESGRDYATTNVSEHELRNVHLPAFKAAVDAGVRTIMTSFSDLNGIPATGNAFLLDQVLREEWGYSGFVVSDWDSVRQLAIHGLTGSDRDSAFEAVTAGVDMEMAGDAYARHLAGLVEEGRVDPARIDAAVTAILRAKFDLGLFDAPYTKPGGPPPGVTDQARAMAHRLARQSAVLLRNQGGILPLDASRIGSIAVVGPLANAPYEQLGTWVFDGDPSLSVTGLEGIRRQLGEDAEVRHVRALDTSRSRDMAAFDDAAEAAQSADVAVVFLGEESILSGEAHSRADIGLPGAQAELVRRLGETGTPLVAVVMAGRPLTLTEIVDDVDALLYAWHPGTMGGVAIAELLFGVVSPSGKLPVTFPRMVGQVPIYYGQKNTGKPPSEDRVMHIDDIPVRAPQTSFGMSAFHLDAGYTPLFPFGFGLSYGDFRYSNVRASAERFRAGEEIFIEAELSNQGTMRATEVAQLYVRDPVASLTRPVRELKGFRRVALEPGETVTVRFGLRAEDLAFYGRDHTPVVEPGRFQAGIGGDATAPLSAEFHLVEDKVP